MSGFEPPTAPLGLFVGPVDATDRYELLAEHASGSEGRLYAGRFAAADGGGLRVAVKALGTVDPLMPVERWLANRAVLRTIHHAHAVRYLDHFVGPPPHGRSLAGGGQAERGPDSMYEVMEWVDGPTLARLVRESPTSAPADRWAPVLDLAHAVDHLHDASSDTLAMVHRDIKPANVVVNPTRGAVLVDFGLARPEHVVATSRAAGTEGFRAPELSEGAAPSRESDRWSTAATAHFVLTGTAPSVSTRKQLTALAEQHGGDPDALVGAFERALDPDPSRRPASMATWATEVAAALGPAPSAERRPRRRPARRLARIALLTAVVVLAGAGWAYRSASHHGAAPATAAGTGTSEPCLVDKAAPKVANAQGLSRAVARCTLSVGAAVFAQRTVTSATVALVEGDGRSQVFCKTLGESVTGLNALGGSVTSPRWVRVHVPAPATAGGTGTDGWLPEYAFRSDMATLRWCGSGER